MMPFIGRDWRSPGEAWVKTEEGWERKKILEKLNRSVRQRLALESCNVDYRCSLTNCDSDNENNNADSNNNGDLEQWQPYCRITLKITKEVAGYNTISEAFRRLDFTNAVRDIRRFNYICKLLHLLITQNLTTLSGCATKVLFTMLEEVAWQVASNQQNIHILHTLLHDLKKTMRKYYCWGRPLGSTLLWEQHLRTIERICLMASHIEIKEPKDGRKLTDLPTELIREILLRLSDYRDLLNSGQAYDVMKALLDEQYIWKQLCYFHFTYQQIHNVLENGKGKLRYSNRIDWQQLFHHLRRKFGLKEEYADYLFLCRHCRCLFWKSFGHPCLDLFTSAQTENEDGNERDDDCVTTVPLYVPVPPQMFLKFFSL